MAIHSMRYILLILIFHLSLKIYFLVNKNISYENLDFLNIFVVQDNNDTNEDIYKLRNLMNVKKFDNYEKDRFPCI
jgi:hypothetical protein